MTERVGREMPKPKLNLDGGADQGYLAGRVHGAPHDHYESASGGYPGDQRGLQSTRGLARRTTVEEFYAFEGNNSLDRLDPYRGNPDTYPLGGHPTTSVEHGYRTPRALGQVDDGRTLSRNPATGDWNSTEHRPIYNDMHYTNGHTPIIRSKHAKPHRTTGRASAIESTGNSLRDRIARIPKWKKTFTVIAATALAAVSATQATIGLGNVKNMALNVIGQNRETKSPEQALSRPFDLFPLSEGQSFSVHTATDTEIQIAYTDKHGQEKLVTNMESTPIVMLGAEKEIWLRLLNTRPETTEEQKDTDTLTIHKLPDNKIEVTINWSSFGLHFTDINLRTSTKEYAHINYLFTQEQIDSAHAIVLPDASPEENARIVKLLAPGENRDSFILFYAQYEAAKKLDSGECFTDPSSSLESVLRTDVERKIRDSLVNESGYSPDNIAIKHQGAPQGIAKNLLETYKDAHVADLVDPSKNGGIVLSTYNASCSGAIINE